MKGLKTFTILSVLVCVLFLFAGCDLSHKHYTDNYGVCRSCGTDITVTIKKDTANNYLPTEFMLQHNTDTYLKFVSNGESKITITINTSSPVVKSIVLYSKSDDYIASKYDSSNPVLVYEEPLTANETYYIKIQSTNSGKANVVIEAE